MLFTANLNDLPDQNVNANLDDAVKRAQSVILGSPDSPECMDLRTEIGQFPDHANGKCTICPEGLAYRADLPHHLSGPAGFTNSGQLSGTHNLNNAMAALDSFGMVYQISPTPTPGISALRYKYPNPVTGKLVIAEKTVYDPSVYSDKCMLHLSQKAGETGFKYHLQCPVQMTFDVTQIGINFRVYIKIDTKTGMPFVANVHPIK